MLHDKQILVFAATGAISGAVARIAAQQGATVWLSGRDSARLDALAQSITTSGGKACVDVVDALDPDAVEAYTARVARDAGRIDGVFNGIGGHPAELGYPHVSTTQTLDAFMLPMERIVKSQFLTARTVGAQMLQQGGGAIVTLSATLSGMTAANMAGISAACGAVEALTRALAGEFGHAGVRVNCVRGSAMPETRTIRETYAGQTAILGAPMPMSLPPLGRPITVDETANTAAFLLSDYASGMTGQVVTVCAGQFVG